MLALIALLAVPVAAADPCAGIEVDDLAPRQLEPDTRRCLEHRAAEAEGDRRARAVHLLLHDAWVRQELGRFLGLSQRHQDLFGTHWVVCYGFGRGLAHRPADREVPSEAWEALLACTEPFSTWPHAFREDDHDSAVLLMTRLWLKAVYGRERALEREVDRQPTAYRLERLREARTLAEETRQRWGERVPVEMPFEHLVCPVEPCATDWEIAQPR